MRSESSGFTPRFPKLPRHRSSGINSFAPELPSAHTNRESQYAKSDADFISKIEGGLQELEETAYWLEILEEMNIFSAEKLAPIRQETGELTAIFVTIVKKVKARKQ